MWFGLGPRNGATPQSRRMFPEIHPSILPVIGFPEGLELS
jgi:hypothetical protein